MTVTDDRTWRTVAELAADRGVAETTIWTRIGELRAKAVEVPVRRGAAGLDEFDVAFLEEHFDHSQAARNRPGMTEFGRAQVAQARARAQLSALELAERTQKLVATETLHLAARAAADALKTALSRLPQKAPDLAGRSERDCRLLLKKTSTEILEAFCAGLKHVGAVELDFVIDLSE